MRVEVRAEGCPYPVEIERMILLFDGTAEVCVTSGQERAAEAGEADLVIRLALRRENGALLAEGDMAGWYEEHCVVLPAAPDEATVRRKGKQVVLKVLHDLLARRYGTGQPWGILTGVRPMKLLHGFLRQGLTKEETARRLAADYGIEPARIDLLSRIADVQREVVPDLYSLYARSVSVYVGIPFCPTHCAYCTFPAYSMQEKRAFAEPFLHALDYEAAVLGEALERSGLSVSAVYVGGGTPTSLSAGELDRLLWILDRRLPGRSPWSEWTVEAGRPDTLTADRVEVMRSWGVTRVSVNPQTFKGETLRAIGRGHSAGLTEKRYRQVREAGFENVNMDIILGLPGETVEDLRHTLACLESLGPDSVTVHTLSFKRTAEVKRHRGRYPIPGASEVRAMMEEAQAWASRCGYRPYYLYRQKDILGNLENIGYAKPGKESLYNICIMEEFQTVVGIGGGAVSKWVTRDGRVAGRHFNPREPRAYVETIREVAEKKKRQMERWLPAKS